MSSRLLLGLASLALVACSEEPASPSAPPPSTGVWFSDVTPGSGLDFVHDAGLTAEKHLPETMGGGAALLDADEDGDLDLFCVQSGPMRLAGPTPGSFRRPEGVELPTHRLFLNQGAWKFLDATKGAGAAAASEYGMGVAVGDADGDGHQDLFVTALGPVRLFQGDGRAHFGDATERSGIRDERWTSGATFFDGDDDGDLDLFVCGYVEIDLARPEWCGARKEGWRSYCHPDRYPGLQDRYWRNQGDGRFVNATESAGFAESWGKGLGVIAGDFDRDGDQDLYVANDSTENILWENQGGGRFADATLLSGTGVDAQGLTEAGMGLACGDVDGDLDFDLMVTNFDDESDTLYIQDGALLFTDETVQRGLEAITRLPVGFGTVFADFDHDGDLDWAVANGHIIDNIQLYHDGQTWAQRGMLCANDGRGHWKEVREAGSLRDEPRVGRGLLAGDLDLDGDLDLVLTQCNGPAALLCNDVGRAQSIEFAGLPNGAWVEATLASGKRLLRCAGPQPSYFGSSAPEAHLALPLSNQAVDKLVSFRVGGIPGGVQAFRVEPPLARGRLAFERGAAGLRARSAGLVSIER